MSCHCHASPCICGWGPATSCACVDPGLETTGKHLMVLDSQFCQRRLQNATGLLWAGPNGFTFSNNPLVQLGALEVSEGDKFGSLVIVRANGLLQQVTPVDGVDGVLKSDGSGRLSFEDISSSFTIPDPLTVTTLNATTVNATNTNVSGTPIFTGLNTDTIVSVVGLNGFNQLVKGQTQSASVAYYFENDTLTGAGTPNYNLVSQTDTCFIGNEISDPDSIASVQDSKTIRIDKAGDYIIDWRGTFTGYSANLDAPITNKFEPGIWLEVNGAITNYGIKSIYQDSQKGGGVGGTHYAVSLAAGSLLRLRNNGSLNLADNTRKTGLTNVSMMLTKIK
jgi:hypothetical protein